MRQAFVGIGVALLLVGCKDGTAPLGCIRCDGGLSDAGGGGAPIDASMSLPDGAMRPPRDMAMVRDLGEKSDHDHGHGDDDLASAPPSDLASASHSDMALGSPPDAALGCCSDMAVGGGGGDMAVGGGGGNDSGGGWVPPGQVDDPLVHAPATAIQVATLPGAGSVLDVGVDRGSGVWAVSTATVYYWPLGGGAFTYNAGNGLARGSNANPFASVGGGVAGQAVIGNRGAIADEMEVNPQNGAVIAIHNMVVPFFVGPEYQEHLIRVTDGIRVAADVDGTFHGTAYVGGIHGFTAWHGLAGGCNCAQFQEHQHFIPGDNMNNCDSTVPRNGCWGGDVKGLAFSPAGDLWAGDEHFVALTPQRSLGPSTDFFQPFSLGIDVFPGVNDEVSALAVDGAGGVFVASFGAGLGYLAPMTHLPSYFDRARQLPQNRLTAVAVDNDGSVWVGTVSGGLARLTGGGWVYYTASSGLPSDSITAIAIDRSSKPRRVIVGTISGVAVYNGP